MVQPQTRSPLTPSLKLPSQKVYLCSCQARPAALASKSQTSKTLKVLNFEINGHAGEFWLRRASDSNDQLLSPKGPRHSVVSYVPLEGPYVDLYSSGSI